MLACIAVTFANCSDQVLGSGAGSASKTGRLRRTLCHWSVDTWWQHHLHCWANTRSSYRPARR